MIEGLEKLKSMTDKAMKIPFTTGVVAKMEEIIDICHEKCQKLRRKLVGKLKEEGEGEVLAVARRAKNYAEQEVVKNLLTVFKSKRESILVNAERDSEGNLLDEAASGKVNSQSSVGKNSEPSSGNDSSGKTSSSGSSSNETSSEGTSGSSGSEESSGESGDASGSYESGSGSASSD